MRFHPTRGAMSIGHSLGGLPPDDLVEAEPNILADMVRVVDTFHDPSPGAMVRVGLAPCSPFSVSRELMRDTAILAREKKVMLHTHLAENAEDIADWGNRGFVITSNVDNAGESDETNTSQLEGSLVAGAH